MEVKLLHYTPLEIATYGALICTNSEDKIENKTKDNTFLKGLIKAGHLSVLEHLYYNFEINGASRSLLQELSRHRHISMSVQSTRWALKKMLNDKDFNFINKHYIPPFSNDNDRNTYIELLSKTEEFIKNSLSKYGNDILKYALNESFTTKLMLSLNARSLRWILDLRTGKTVLKEFKDLCYKIFDSLPEDHKFLFEDVIKR